MVKMVNLEGEIELDGTAAERETSDKFVNTVSLVETHLSNNYTISVIEQTDKLIEETWGL